MIASSNPVKLVKPIPQPKHAAGLRFEGSTVDMARDRAIVERRDLVLACAHLLHTNGQSTHETVQAAERLAMSWVYEPR